MDDVVDEVVGLWEPGGQEVGSAPRSRVRAENLHHAATAIVVRDGAGNVYVHRRTATKDVYPGLHDCCAGGVLLAGEAPLAGATREVGEELGVRGTVLEPIGRGTYRDAHTSYEAFCYATTYDGPITWQPEEVAWGDWMPVADVVAMLGSEQMVPDTTSLIGPWLRALG